MAGKLTECSFLVPIHPDDSSQTHPLDHWEWLFDETWRRFNGGTIAPGSYSGFYSDLDSGERVNDESRKFFVAIPLEELDRLRGLLVEVCELFHQKCIYLNVGGTVEFVYRLDLLN